MSNLIEQIQKAYEADQQKLGQKVHSSDELPLSYEAITDEWLTDALCKRHPEAKVIAHRLGPVDSGTSNRRKIQIDYNESGRAAGLPTALFCKATHGLANRITLGLAGAVKTEVAFYNSVRAHLDLEAPRGFFANYDPHSYNSIVMLGDLSVDPRTEFCSDKTEMTRARAESQIRLLAALHGKCFQAADIQSQLGQFSTWPEYFQNVCGFGLEKSSKQGFVDAAEVIPPALYRREAEIWSATLKSVDRHNHLPQTLAHGDVHLKNWYIAGSGEMGLSDWQCAHRGHWSRDFAYAISTALTVENRRLWEQDLLRFYLDRLHAAGGPVVEFNEAWTHYRQQLMTALTWWTVTLSPQDTMPDMQPRDITLEFIRRISIAMDDVDSLGSFYR